MKKKLLIAVVCLIIIILGVFFWLSIKTEKQITNSHDNNQTLPLGYSLDNYTIEKVLDEKCDKKSDCTTPGEYLVRSSCPFTTECLKNKCTIICPKF